MMIVGLALLLQAAPLGPLPDTQAEDWGCASPLIAKNYQQPVKAEELARRIADECVRPYVAASPESLTEGYRRNTYTLQVRTFTLEIEAKLLQARRKDAITIKR